MEHELALGTETVNIGWDSLTDSVKQWARVRALAIKHGLTVTPGPVRQVRVRSTRPVWWQRQHNIVSAFQQGGRLTQHRKEIYHGKP